MGRQKTAAITHLSAIRLKLGEKPDQRIRITAHTAQHISRGRVSLKLEFAGILRHHKGAAKTDHLFENRLFSTYKKTDADGDHGAPHHLPKRMLFHHMPQLMRQNAKNNVIILDIGHQFVEKNHIIPGQGKCVRPESRRAAEMQAGIGKLRRCQCHKTLKFGCDPLLVIF